MWTRLLSGAVSTLSIFQQVHPGAYPERDCSVHLQTLNLWRFYGMVLFRSLAVHGIFSYRGKAIAGNLSDMFVLFCCRLDDFDSIIQGRKLFCLALPLHKKTCTARIV